MSRKNFFVVGLLLLGLALVACNQQAPATPCSTCPTCPEPPKCPEPEVGIKAPFEELWAGSGHADKTAMAFNDWNDADPKEVPANCAKCHSTPGYLDFLGADGSEAGKVDKNAPIGTVITCEACHNEATQAMTSVKFPSGLEVTNLGPEARCMQCHQGRSSTNTVNATFERLGLTDSDVITTGLSFANIHYFAAAATQFGKEAGGGYEYPDKLYDVKFQHVDGYNTCVGCHDSHTLELKINECQVCHTNVKSAQDLENIRMEGSQTDYDGDDDVKEGLAAEIDGLREALYKNIQAYAAEANKTPIGYTPDTHPYFFKDTNNDGKIDETEAVSDNRYNAFSPRLLKAAYNYQVSIKDPGAFAHGGKYIIELLYDSIQDLNAKVSKPIDMAKMHRIDAGHFASSQMPFRDWDDSGLVPANCAKCHSAVGLPIFLRDAANTGAPTASGFACSTCHDETNWPARYAVTEVTFPSGAKITFSAKDADGKLAANDANLCIVCHQGRESTTSVNKAIAGLQADTPSTKVSFRNVHYFAAGATLFGAEAKGAYEYDGKTYLGRNMHVDGFNTCVQCHSTHGLAVKEEACAGCHASVKDAGLESIRMSTTDYDGDDNTTEGMVGEIETLREALYAAIQAYAKDVAGSPIAYDSGAYPYFFTDTNDNGKVDADEAVRTNNYKNWTPRLLQAAYNYQYTAKDPGAFAHNGTYIVQVLVDSLESLGEKATVGIKPTRP